MGEPAEVLPDVPPMPEVMPEPKRRMFTKENAVEMAKRAALARKANKEQREKALREAEQLAQQSPDVRTRERCEIVADQITRTHAALQSKRMQPRDRAQLLLALDRLLDRERVLLGLPLPGSRRPGKERTSSGQQGSAAQGPLD